MHLLKYKNFWFILFLDICAVVLCFILAFGLRFGGDVGQLDGQITSVVLPLVGLKMIAFFTFDLYRGMWRYAGVNDLINVIKASVVGSFLFVVYMAMFHHFEGMSRSVLIADCIFTIVAVGGIRLGVRVYYQRDPKFLEDIVFWRRSMREEHRVLILGTGALAEQLYRELCHSTVKFYKIVGFVDEGGFHKGLKIHGVPIAGNLKDIPRLIGYYSVNEVMVASTSLMPEIVSKLVDVCSAAGVELKTVEPLGDRSVDNIANNLRSIKVEDLLDREPVRLDMDLVRQEIEGKCVLVTGAGGSIGSELARQILSYRPSTLVLLDNAETPLYRIDMELQNLEAQTVVIPCIGDVRSSRNLERIFKKFKPEYVYHAAAYKHVPMMEMAPLDAVNNNIMGTYKLAMVACKYHVNKFVMISTDKAVRPTSVMGTTKRVAEMVVQSMNGNGTRFAVVRFGNVLGSNGSVVPLFERQIAEGGPVTVTHPDVTRYFMTIPEAVQLVLQAGSIGQGGELFLLDMGSPVKIIDLARKMIRLAGKVPERDIEIECVGLRPGEKLYEELLIDDEGVVDTAYDKIKICNSSCGVDEEKLYAAIEKFKLLIESSGDQSLAVSLLYKLVPAYEEQVRMMDDRLVLAPQPLIEREEITD